MKNCKNVLILLSLLFILIISLGIVSASEIDDAGAVGTSDEVMDADANELETIDNGENTIEAIDDEQTETLSNTRRVNGNSFDDIQAAIDEMDDGDILELNGTFKTTGDHINVTKSISIKGVGKATLDGKNSSSIFYFIGENITCSDLTFTNANHAYKPAIGCIFENDGKYGSYSFLNCNFENNYVSCISLYCNDLHISKCTFKNNYASDGTLAIHSQKACIEKSSFIKNNGYYGAIYSDSPNLIISSSSFTNNKANEGGAIYAESSFSIADSTFTNNKADYGGVIKTNSTCTIKDSRFIKNHAEEGIISTTADTLISGSHFENNSAAMKGAVLYSTAKVNIENSKFINNSAKHGSAIESKGKITVKNSDFTRNSGVITGSSYVTNCNFNYNTGVSIGGLTHVINSKFKYNLAGAISAIGNSIVEKSSFIGNEADQGGAIYSEGSLTVKSCIFEKNKVSGIENSDGGAIHAEKLTVKDSTFKENYAASSGGALFSNSKKILINGCTFLNNHGKSGGAIYSEGRATVKNSIFKKNRAVHGGAIYVSRLSMQKSAFSSNRATLGGAVYCYYGTIKKSNFTKNYAKRSGGAIWSEKKSSIVSSRFISNSAKTYGSAISSWTSNLKLKSCKFSKNSLGKGSNPFYGPFRNYGKGIIACGGTGSKFSAVKCKGIVKNTKKYKFKTQVKVPKSVASGKNLIVRVVDSHYKKAIMGIKVRITLNGKKHIKKVNSKGKAKLLVKLRRGTYRATVSFAGNNNYFKSSKSINLLVKR